MEPGVDQSDPDLAAQFLVDRDVSCPGCGYNLRGTKTLHCPECGREFKLAVVCTGAVRLKDAPNALFMVAALGWSFVSSTLTSLLNLRWLFRFSPPGSNGGALYRFGLEIRVHLTVDLLIGMTALGGLIVIWNHRKSAVSEVVWRRWLSYTKWISGAYVLAWLARVVWSAIEY